MTIALAENNNPEYSITRQVKNHAWSLSHHKHIGSVVYKLYFREDHNSYKLIGEIESYILEGNTIDANYFVSNIPPYDPYMYRGYPVDYWGDELRTKTKFSNSLTDLIKQFIEYHKNLQNLKEIKSDKKQKNKSEFRVEKSVVNGGDGWKTIYYIIYHNDDDVGVVQYAEKEGVPQIDRWQNKMYVWQIVASGLAMSTGTTNSLNDAVKKILSIYNTHRKITENSNEEKNTTGFFKIYSKIENGPKTDLQTRSVYYNGRYLGRVQSELNKDTGTTIPDTYGTAYQYRWLVDNNHSSISSGFTNSLTFAIQKILEIHRKKKTITENSNNEKNNTGFRVNTWVEKFEGSDLQYRSVFYNGKYLGEVISVLDKDTGMTVPDTYAAKPAPGWIYGPPETDDKYMYRWIAKHRADITLGYGNTNSLTDGIQQIIDTHRKNKTITENTEEVTTNNKYHVVKTDIKRGNEEINNFEVFCDDKSIGSAVRVSVDKIINPVYWNGKSTYNWYIHGKYIAGISHGYTDSLHEAISNIIKNHKVKSLLIKVPANVERKSPNTIHDSLVTESRIGEKFWQTIKNRFRQNDNSKTERPKYSATKGHALGKESIYILRNGKTIGAYRRTKGGIECAWWIDLPYYTGTNPGDTIVLSNIQEGIQWIIKNHEDNRKIYKLDQQLDETTENNITYSTVVDDYCYNTDPKDPIYKRQIRVLRGTTVVGYINYPFMLSKNKTITTISTISFGQPMPGSYGQYTAWASDEEKIYQGPMYFPELKNAIKWIIEEDTHALRKKLRKSKKVQNLKVNEAKKNKKYSTKVYREDPLPSGEGYLNTIEIYFGKKLIGEINWCLTKDKILDMTNEPPFEARFFKADVNKIDDIVQRSKNISHQYFNSIISASKWIIENHKKLSTSKDKKSSPMNEAVKNKIYSTKVIKEVPLLLGEGYLKKILIFFGRESIGEIFWCLTKDKILDMTNEPPFEADFYIRPFGNKTVQHVVIEKFNDITSASKWIIESHKQMLKDKEKIKQ